MATLPIDDRSGPGVADAAPATRAGRRRGRWLGTSSLVLVLGGPAVAWLISNLPYPAQGWLEPVMFVGMLAVPVGMALGMVTMAVNAADRRAAGRAGPAGSGPWLGGLAIVVGLGLIGFVLLLFVLVVGYLAGGM